MQASAACPAFGSREQTLFPCARPRTLFPAPLDSSRSRSVPRLRNSSQFLPLRSWWSFHRVRFAPLFVKVPQPQREPLPSRAPQMAPAQVVSRQFSSSKIHLHSSAVPAHPLPSRSSPVPPGDRCRCTQLAVVHRRFPTPPSIPCHSHSPPAALRIPATSPSCAADLNIFPNC